MKNTLVVIGNGLSAKKQNLRSLDCCDTFGLNKAYKNYARLNWYPTYHGCFDNDFISTYGHELFYLIETGKIQMHFYTKRLTEHPRFQYVKMAPYCSQELVNQDVLAFDNFTDQGNSGMNACSIGICLGYKKILLLGIDLNYTQRVNVPFKVESDDPKQRFVTIDKFPGPTWKNFAKQAEDLGVKIINCSPISQINYFEKQELEKALESA